MTHLKLWFHFCANMKPFPFRLLFPSLEVLDQYMCNEKERIYERHLLIIFELHVKLYESFLSRNLKSSACRKSHPEDGPSKNLQSKINLKKLKKLKEDNAIVQIMCIITSSLVQNCNSCWALASLISFFPIISFSLVFVDTTSNCLFSISSTSFFYIYIFIYFFSCTFILIYLIWLVLFFSVRI